MLGQAKTVSYTKLKTAMENDILNRFPTIAKHINAINIDKNHFSGDLRSAGFAINTDSNVCSKEALPKGYIAQKAIRTEISDATKAYIDKQMDSLMKSGMSEAEAHKKVQDSLEPVMGYDAKAQQYVIGVRAPVKDSANKDSLLEQTSIPMWNIGWLTKIIKQPFATSHAKNLVSVESFSNPFADGKEKVIFDPKQVYDFELDKTKDLNEILTQLKSALDKKQKRAIELEVTNVNRSLGTIFGSEITKKYDDTLEDDSYVIKCNGAGGQSFGAFIPKGLTLELVGDSNDYFGKGLSGGKLVVYPPAGVKYKKDENIIIGNVALYGATSGKAFINGVAGERFCVRNSGATAVVEGVGDHGCEYMTGGRVVILGKTGKNFAAGMSGGIAYVLDEDNDLYMRTNKQMVFTEEVSNKYDVLELKEMIKEHVTLTNSEKGKEILDNFSEYLPKFKKVIPYDYNRMQMAIVQMEEKGLSSEQAQIEAFYANAKH